MIISNMKIIEIFKTKKEYKIITLYKLESGSYISSLPISILEIESSIDNLYDEINRLLNHSRKISSKEEQKFWLGSDLLKHLKIASFKKLYTSSSSCNVTFINDEFRVITKIYDTKLKALIESDNILTFEKNDFKSLVEFIKFKL